MTDALKKVVGVQSVDVDLDAHKATVAFDSAKASVSQLAQAIRDAGFTPQSA